MIDWRIRSWKGRRFGEECLCLNRLVSFSEKMSSRSSICGGMSLHGGFHGDLTYSLEGRWVKSSLGTREK